MNVFEQKDPLVGLPMVTPFDENENVDLDAAEFNLDKWKKIVKIFNNPKKIIKIAIVGKYTNLVDSYKSLVEAINHGSIANNIKVDIIWINSEKVINNNNHNQTKIR